MIWLLNLWLLNFNNLLESKEIFCLFENMIIINFWIKDFNGHQRHFEFINYIDKPHIFIIDFHYFIN